MLRRWPRLRRSGERRGERSGRAELVHIATGTWGAFHATLWFDLAHQFPYAFQALEGVAARGDQAGVRLSTFASVAASYDFTDWVSNTSFE